MFGKASKQTTERMQNFCTDAEVLYRQTPVAFICTRVKAIFTDD